MLSERDLQGSSLSWTACAAIVYTMKAKTLPGRTRFLMTLTSRLTSHPETAMAQRAGSVALLYFERSTRSFACEARVRAAARPKQGQRVAVRSTRALRRPQAWAARVGSGTFGGAPCELTCTPSEVTARQRELHAIRKTSQNGCPIVCRPVSSSQPYPPCSSVSGARFPTSAGHRQTCCRPLSLSVPTRTCLLAVVRTRAVRWTRLVSKSG